MSIPPLVNAASNGSFLSTIDDNLNSAGLKLENMFNVARRVLPQNKYFLTPLYKMCVGKIGPVAATGVCFLAADLLIHQLATEAFLSLLCKMNSEDLNEGLELDGLDLNDRSSCQISYSFACTLSWAAFAIPVMYVKYKRATTRNSEKKAIENS